MNERQAQSDTGYSRGRWILLIGAIILMGVVFRVIKALQIYFIPDSDYTLVALMVKHMAAGCDHPVFFYGQMYMGSLEPALTALLCKLLGLDISLFNVFLGTALIGSLSFPLIYLWAREAGGRYAGLVALLVSLVGSESFLHFAVAPCGGYMVMLVSGLIALYLSCRIVIHLKAGLKVTALAYVALGLAGGVGWWSGQLVIVFLLPALLILLLGISWTLMRNGLLLALPAFFIGSAPWWIWNATHEWATFAFSKELDVKSAADGMSAFWTSLLRAMGYSASDNVGASLVLLLVLVMVILFFVLLTKDAIYYKCQGPFVFKFAAPLVVLALLAVSVTSKYISIENNHRYFLPVFPAIAVMLGCAVGWLIQKKIYGLGWLVGCDRSHCNK